MAGNIWNYKNNLRNIPETKCNPSVTVFWQHETDGKSLDQGWFLTQFSTPQPKSVQSNRSLFFQNSAQFHCLAQHFPDTRRWEGHWIVTRFWKYRMIDLWTGRPETSWQKPEGEGEGALIFVKPAVGAGFTGIAGGVDLQNPLICWCHLSLKFKDTENQYTIDALA